MGFKAESFHVRNIPKKGRGGYKGENEVKGGKTSNGTSKRGDKEAIQVISGMVMSKLSAS